MIFDGENAFARRSVCCFNEPVCPTVLYAIFNTTLPPTRPRMPSAVANVCGGAPCAANGAVPSACTPRDAYTGIAARTEIARLRYGRPRRTERRRRATETHFTHPWVRTGGPVVQGYHLNYVDANDRGRRRRRVAAASSPPRRSVRRR